MQEAIHRTNKERSDATRAALVTAARALFVERGYADTATPEIVRAAEVTRGALYHHFTGKADLFDAVVVGEARAVRHEIDRVVGTEGDAGDALAIGSNAFFAAMAVPGRVRLLLLDGPAVLGRRRLDEIDRDAGGEALLRGLRAVMPNGVIDGTTTEILADVLSAAFDRAALAIADGAPADGYKAALRLVVSSVVAQARRSEKPV